MQRDLQPIFTKPVEYPSCKVCLRMGGHQAFTVFQFGCLKIFYIVIFLIREQMMVDKGNHPFQIDPINSLK